ncbi:MAG: 4-diphosphocytidyl-2C-methyl-D-erythritol kinase [Alphaproteobacteria bacterium]|nr:4-diphosphocytidyl-2C-methyl-D-erythritol kinase [Alphaproteobacteria bacterium]
MKFGPTPLDEATGAILAHSVRLPKGSFKKGRVLTAEDVEALRAAGRESVVAARIEADDIGEDEAASRVAAACLGANIETSAAFTGRCNLFATGSGVLVVDRARIDRINLVDEAVTIATVPPFALVGPRDMLATIKVIPFAAPRGVVEACEAIAREGGPLMRVAPLAALRAGLILTASPGMKASILERTVEATRDRVQALGGSLPDDGVIRCGHDEAEVAAAIRTLLDRDTRILMISGASAIVDRRDVIPAAIVAAGGVIDHFGMPVDPGNLMLMAHHDGVPVLGLPGCARSPKLNGFDWILERLYAGLPVEREDIMRMGAGGLLKEIASRPLPRAEAVQRAEPAMAPARAPRIGALVLAAGQSRRMGPVNKLLADVHGKPMTAHVLDAVLASKARPVVVVLGHEADRVERALAGRPVTFMRNPDYAGGLSTSLKRGLAALPDDVDGAVVVLGDMPDVQAAHIDKLIAAYDPVEGRAICVPTFNGKRGNPVLWDRRFFRAMGEVAGDVGARHLIGESADLVCEVPVSDPGVLIDLDTPEALAAHAATRSA